MDICSAVFENFSEGRGLLSGNVKMSPAVGVSIRRRPRRGTNIPHGMRVGACGMPPEATRKKLGCAGPVDGVSRWGKFVGSWWDRATYLLSLQ